MTKQEIFELMKKNPQFTLGTIEGDQPRVRGMLLYRADEGGILFHTGAMKDVYQQLLKNPKAELCFIDSKTGQQIRISGTLTILEDNNLKDTIANDPNRAFVKAWKETGAFTDFYKEFIVLKMKHGKATHWTMADNFSAKKEITL